MTNSPTRGHAGLQGDAVRSDLLADIERRDSGGLTLEIQSKVEPYYGAAIRNQVTETLAALGVTHARVIVDDKGALPFVIQARLEAAAREAGFGVGQDARPPPAAKLAEPTTKDRLRRSRLYLPGNEPKFMVNAGLHGPDGVILDLEDSVHPDHKSAARYLVRNALRDLDFASAERMVRINQGVLGLRDLELVVPESPDLILIPKVETAGQVRAVDTAIERIQQAHALDRPLWLMPILESALGIENAHAIATASLRVVALTIGLEDFTADLGVVKTAAGDETAWARSRLVIAARAAGVQAIDSVYGAIDDSAGLLAWAQRARAMGYVGMGCVHPRQIPIIHQGFAPSAEEIDKAKRIVAAFEEAQAKGLAVVNLGSKMVDPPVVERALRLVKQAQTMGLAGTGTQA